MLVFIQLTTMEKDYHLSSFITIQYKYLNEFQFYQKKLDNLYLTKNKLLVIFIMDL